MEGLAVATVAAATVVAAKLAAVKARHECRSRCNRFQSHIRCTLPQARHHHRRRPWPNPTRHIDRCRPREGGAGAGAPVVGCQAQVAERAGRVATVASKE